MRDLLFKNLTSGDKRKKIIASSEISENRGVRSVIHRHFVCMVREVKKQDQASRPLPSLHILKERNTKEQKEKFFCRIKGSVYVAHRERLFLVLFAHSLKISLVAVAQGLSNIS